MADMFKVEITRKEFLTLPIVTRRRILAQQAEALGKIPDDLDVLPMDADRVFVDCTEENPCCDHRNEYNGFASGPLKFICPKHCSCHN